MKSWWIVLYVVILVIALGVMAMEAKGQELECPTGIQCRAPQRPIPDICGYLENHWACKWPFAQMAVSGPEERKQELWEELVDYDDTHVVYEECLSSIQCPSQCPECFHLPHDQSKVRHK